MTAAEIIYLAAVCVQLVSNLVWLVVVGRWLYRWVREPRAVTPERISAAVAAGGEGRAVRMRPSWITIGMPLLACASIGIRFALGERWNLAILQAPMWLVVIAAVVYLRRLHEGRRI